MSDNKQNGAARFEKERLIRSERFAERADLLGALLADGKKYTVEETEKAIEKYLKGKVI